MCVLVTISEKRGIVYTEHMPVAEAAVAAAAAAAAMEAKRGLEVGGGGPGYPNTLTRVSPGAASLCAFWEPVNPLM